MAKTKNWHCIPINIFREDTITKIPVGPFDSRFSGGKPLFFSESSSSPLHSMQLATRQTPFHTFLQRDDIRRLCCKTCNRLRSKVVTLDQETPAAYSFFSSRIKCSLVWEIQKVISFDIAYLFDQNGLSLWSGHYTKTRQFISSLNADFTWHWPLKNFPEMQVRLILQSFQTRRKKLLWR